MSLYKYSFDTKDLAVAQIHDVDCSYKDLGQVLQGMKGKTVAHARKMLEDAISMKKPIAFKKFNTGMGHRSQLGGKKGKYPKKECAFAMQLLNNAAANGVKKGMDPASMVVKQAAAYKQTVFKRYRARFANSHTLGYGKQALWGNYVTSRAEIGLIHEEQKPKKVKKTKTDKKPAAKAEVKAEVKEMRKN